LITPGGEEAVRGNRPVSYFRNMWYNVPVAEERYLACLKYTEKVAMDDPMCPYPNDFCAHRTRCIIHARCMEDPGCREKRRKRFENT